MLYPIGSPSRIRLLGAESSEVSRSSHPSELDQAMFHQVISICPNRERNLLAVVTPTSLSLLCAHPLAAVFTLNRTPDAIEERGLHVK